MKIRCIKKLICLAVAMLTAFMLCGCDILTTDTEGLLSPPEPSGDIYPIQQALKNSIKGDYTLKYPTSGDRRSAVILEDIDNDNTFEAFAFYSTVEEDVMYMNVNFIIFKDEEWQSVARQSIVAGGVESVDFCDLDGDGRKEIVVGWVVFGETEKQLAVYSCTLGTLSQRMLQRYTSYLCCDLDENEEYEVFVQNLDTAAAVNTASLFAIDREGVSEIAGCLMDKNVKTASAPVIGELSSGQSAIYIDEIKGAGSVTEVLVFSQGQLLNPLLDTATTENISTLRTTAITSKDINLDGIIEIPVSRELPSAGPIENSEKFYYTVWCSFNGEVLTQKLVTVMNMTDGYYVAIPTKWEGNIAVLRDTENHSRMIYTYDPLTFTVGEAVAYFAVVSEKDWESGKVGVANCVEACRKDEKVYIASDCGANGPLAVTQDELKGMLRLIE